ncbi:MAG: bifunctional helix-turn-helix transcriptional regulator/GNAT family N-acetyltransferase [Cyanobacteria bacterium P01_F01_bin.3]
MDFYSQVGKVAIGSRLRRLSESLTEDAAEVYGLYGVPADPRWFPVLYVLSKQESATVTEIARAICHSHPSVSQIIKQMNAKGLVNIQKSQQDARVSVISLSQTGRQAVPSFEQQCADVEQATETLLSQAQNDLWAAIEEIEFLLDSKSLLDRVKAVRKARECLSVSIVDYRPEFQTDFARLNYAWIEQYFKVEETDRQSLEDPETKILKPGGHIFMAEIDGDIVGTCALIKSGDGVYELAKMAVAETARGKGVGCLLGKTALEKARDLGARSIFLESNTALKPAINLYQKLGFKKVVRNPSPYERCNIQMALSMD